MRMFYGKGSPLEPLERGDQVIVVNTRGAGPFCVLVTVSSVPVERDDGVEFMTELGEAMKLGRRDEFYVRRPVLCQ